MGETFYIHPNGQNSANSVGLFYEGLTIKLPNYIDP